MNMFDGIATFLNKLCETHDFFATLIKEDVAKPLEYDCSMFLEDITYQGNIMLFVLRGEIEKMRGTCLQTGCILSVEQEIELNNICEKVDAYIQLAHNAKNESDLKLIIDKLSEIKHDLIIQADILNDKGRAIRFLGEEFGRFVDAIIRFVPD
jgi:hypothetical protein